MNLNYRILSGLFLFLFSLSGCGNNLSREKAFDLVNAALPKPISGFLETGSGVLFHNHTPIKLSTAKKLADDKVINFVFVAQPIPDSQVYKVLLTDKGKQYIVKGREGQTVILLGERNLVKITGMKMTTDNKKAEVEFEWKVINLTPFGKVVQNQNFNGGLLSAEMPIESNEKTYPGTASISLYDDGWRIDKNSLKLGAQRLFHMGN
jgi:hypothetical protein